VKALMTLLGLPENAFYSLVFFVGGAEFKTSMPCNVINKGLRSWIEKHTAPLLDPDAVRIANSRLETLCQTTDRKAAARDHLRALAARHA
jgi:hypothetical protein